MNLKTIDDVLKYIVNEISIKRSKIISFTYPYLIGTTEEIYRRVIDLNPNLLLCINTFSVSTVFLGLWNQYAINITYSDVYSSFVSLVDSKHQVRKALLESSRAHRKQEYLVCKELDVEMVLSTAKQIVSNPEYLNCFVSEVHSSVLRRNETDYVGVVVRLMYSCDYQTAKVRGKLCNEKINLIANVARSSGKEDWRKAFTVIDYCVEHWEYCLSEDNGVEFTAYGALVNEKAVCMGFSLAICAIFKELGIPCKYICGERNGEGHAWNMVFVNGGWFYIDVTDAVGMKDPFYHWGVEKFDDGRIITTSHKERLKCLCDRNFIICRLYPNRRQ